jgi:hypothetical protein
MKMGNKYPCFFIIISFCSRSSQKASVSEELPGKPDGLDGLLFGFEDMAMVVCNETRGEIWHDGVPPFGI